MADSGFHVEINRAFSRVEAKTPQAQVHAILAMAHALKQMADALDRAYPRGG